MEHIPTELRQRYIKVYKRHFGMHITKAKELEFGVYAYTKKYIKHHDYSEESIVMCVYSDKHDMIINYLNEYEVDYDNIDYLAFAEMSPYQLYSDKYKDIEARKRLNDKYQNNIITSDIYTCKKCKAKECTVMQSQTRGSDEAITTFVICINCGTRWRVD